MIVDANILLYAVDSASPSHAVAAKWLTDALNGNARVGLPLQSLTAFTRIATHPRVTPNPLNAERAHSFLDAWLRAPAAWVPPVTERTARIYSTLARTHGITSNLVPDAALAALGVEFGVPIISADSDFKRFPEVTWINPLAPSSHPN
ncbi:type II toxin-antitoxin system VapC family toxin [Tessaracoccus terricola]